MENISEARWHRNLSVKMEMEGPRPSYFLAWAYGALLCLLLRSADVYLNCKKFPLKKSFKPSDSFPSETVKKEKSVSIHINPILISNLYIISFYFQNVYLKKEARKVLTPLKLVEAKEPWPEVTWLICDRAASDIIQGYWLHQVSYFHWLFLGAFQAECRNP